MSYIYILLTKLHYHWTFIPEVMADKCHFSQILVTFDLGQVCPKSIKQYLPLK